MEGKMEAHARKTKNRKELWTDEMNGLLSEKLLKALFSTSSFPICSQRKKLLTKSQKKILNISLYMCKQKDRESSPSPSVCKDTQEQFHSSALAVTSGVLQQDTSIRCDASCSSKLALVSYTCVINRCYMHLPRGTCLLQVPPHAAPCIFVDTTSSDVAVRWYISHRYTSDPEPEEAWRGRSLLAPTYCHDFQDTDSYLSFPSSWQQWEEGKPSCTS